MSDLYDVIIIGAGVTGSAIAHELSQYKLKVAVLDKNSDVCEGTSKANSGIIHAGYDAKPGTLKARLNVRGSKMMPELARKLDIPFYRNGSLVVCLREDELDGLKELYERGIENGVERLKLLSRKEALIEEPNLSEDTKGALFAPTGGIVCPFNLTIAFAEHAAINGVEFFLRTEVKNIVPVDEGYELSCMEYDTYDENLDKEVKYRARVVVNAAGVYADVIHNMVCSEKIKITPRKGEYCLLDTTVGDYVKHTVFKMPGALGKGILVTPTIHGNLLVGPTACDIDDRDGIFTTKEGIASVNDTNATAVRDVPMREVMTSFAGLRPHADRGDFIIEEAKGCINFIDAAGIESPGLTASPAIGEMVGNMIKDRLHPEYRTDYIAERKGVTLLKFLPVSEQAKLIEQDRRYGNIVCRCSNISEGELVETIHRVLGATTLDGIKRRTGANMGRCQGGFCYPKAMEILSRELNIPLEAVTKCGRGSEIIKGNIKENIDDAF